MTNQPPLELIQQWANEKVYDERDWLYEIHIANCAAQWSANEELKACCKWADETGWTGAGSVLRRHRRLKPQSLNDIALQMLGTIERDAHYLPEITDTIRRALLSNITDDFNKNPQK